MLNPLSKLIYGCKSDMLTIVFSRVVMDSHLVFVVAPFFVSALNYVHLHWMKHNGSYVHMTCSEFGSEDTFEGPNYGHLQLLRILEQCIWVNKV